MRNPKSIWTEPAVDLLKKLWRDGDSASEIAAQIGGGLTRNAVLGKVHRLGLSERSSKPRSTPHKYMPRTHARRKVPSLPVSSALRMDTRSVVEEIAAPEIVLPEGANRSVTLMELGPNDCRAVLDEQGEGGDLLYCGQTKTRDRSGRRSAYCSHHHSLFSMPPQKARR